MVFGNLFLHKVLSLLKQGDFSVCGPRNICLITNFCNFKLLDSIWTEICLSIDSEVYYLWFGCNVIIICACGKPLFFNSVEYTKDETGPKRFFFVASFNNFLNFV